MSALRDHPGLGVGCGATHRVVVVPGSGLPSSATCWPEALRASRRPVSPRSRPGWLERDREILPVDDRGRDAVDRFAYFRGIGDRYGAVFDRPGLAVGARDAGLLVVKAVQNQRSVAELFAGGTASRHRAGHSSVVLEAVPFAVGQTQRRADAVLFGVGDPILDRSDPGNREGVDTQDDRRNHGLGIGPDRCAGPR